MRNSKHYSEGRISRIDIAKVPHRDLADLNLDAESANCGTETSIEHIPVYIEYNDEEDWYWRYGEERLYHQVFTGGKNPESEDISWAELHCFLTNFAWVDPKWRFILDKPCWPFHSDVVDHVVMLYHGRKRYERMQGTLGAREMMDTLDLSTKLSELAEKLLEHCKIETGKEKGGVYRYVRHVCDESTRKWIPSVLHRALEFKDSPLPASPVMKTSFNLDRLKTNGGPDKRKPRQAKRGEPAPDLDDA
ncbi:MAG: hypothetical protein M0Z39_01060 [Actinomycetota bacterium]|jgi:hypothetical protein|nr:hypothetical protein [Actinomycetota bacterium]